MNITKRQIFILLIVLVASDVIAQEKQKIPVDFFEGKWAGEIKGSVWADSWHPFRIELIGNRSMDADVIAQAKYPPVAFQAKGGIVPVAPDMMMLMIDIGDPISIPTEALGFVAVLCTGVFKIVESSDKTVKLFFDAITDYMQATAELYRVESFKKTFPKDIKPNKPIKTDKKTQLEITMPSKDIIDIAPINIAPNTELVIKSENLLEIVKGKIHGLIKKLKPNAKFEIRTPTSVIVIRGPAEYKLNVEDDGTTTVIVLDGEVEFSDIENKKTVIVKKNQKSVVKPGILPTDPEEIDPEKILNWWE